MKEMIVSALVGMVVAGLLHAIGKEAGGRAPWALRTIVKLAARRLPEDLRREFADEWMAEVAAVLADSAGLPVTKACRAVRYCVSLLRSTRDVGDALTPVAEQQPFDADTALYLEKVFGNHGFIRLRDVDTGHILTVALTAEGRERLGGRLDIRFPQPPAQGADSGRSDRGYASDGREDMKDR